MAILLFSISIFLKECRLSYYMIDFNFYVWLDVLENKKNQEWHVWNDLCKCEKLKLMIESLCIIANVKITVNLYMLIIVNCTFWSVLLFDIILLINYISCDLVFCKKVISLYNEIILYVIIYYCVCHDNALDILNYFSMHPLKMLYFFWICEYIKS
jgi:hypothetical protein